MGDGTSAMGKRGSGSNLIQRCRRCGSRSYRVRKKRCSSCGFGETSKLRSYAWQSKHNGKRTKNK